MKLNFKNFGLLIQEYEAIIFYKTVQNKFHYAIIG